MDLGIVSPKLRGDVASLTDLPEYIISTFFPAAKPLLQRYPRLFRVVGFLLAFYYFGPLSHIRSLWDQCSSLLVSSVQVTSDEDLFNYLLIFLAEKRAIRPNQSLNAITNPMKESKRSRHDPEYEETAQQSSRKDSDVRFEQGQGLQIFVHGSRLFWVQRSDGDGHSYYGNRSKRQEVLKFNCLGRSVEPIKRMMEVVYRDNKDREKSLTVIRRPYGSGYGSRLTWSRLTAKRRRQLDTVILRETQTAAVLADVEEYMSEKTKTFYANHGIPYRRGYLFHGPPGCGKTSFCLALASQFDLDVYILTLLDKDITDTDLMSLLNQLPTPSLLLLEDVDEAGLNRKSKFSASQRKSRKSKKGAPNGAIDPDDGLDSSDEDRKPRTQVTLSGLLNAIDGVAAPEGHILIMTTNKPQELDEALVRAGRISVHVEFSNANKKQAEQIFLRMYSDLQAKEKSTVDLDRLARKFGDKILDGEFSPADLQDYLLVYKTDPVAATTEFQKWMESKVEEKKRKEEEKELEYQYRAKKSEERRQKWKKNVKKALQEDEDEANSESPDGKETEGKVQDVNKEEEAPESDGKEAVEKSEEAETSTKEAEA